MCRLIAHCVGRVAWIAGYAHNLLLPYFQNSRSRKLIRTYHAGSLHQVDLLDLKLAFLVILLFRLLFATGFHLFLGFFLNLLLFLVFLCFSMAFFLGLFSSNPLLSLSELLSFWLIIFINLYSSQFLQIAGVRGERSSSSSPSSWGLSALSEF